MVRFENQIKSKKILVACFDAGGADVVSSWIFVSKLKNFESYKGDSSPHATNPHCSNRYHVDPSLE